MNLGEVLSRRAADPESWLYTDWRKLNPDLFEPPSREMRFSLALPAASSPHRIVFVAGSFRPDLSTLQTFPAGLLSACDDGTCEMHAEKAHCLALAPVELLYVWPDTPSPTYMPTRFALTLGEHARLTLIEKHVGQSLTAEGFHQSETEIHLAESAKLIHGKIVSGERRSIHYARTHVVAEKGAFYDRLAFVHGGQSTRSETEVELNGELGEARLLAIKLLDGDSHADTLLRVRHNAPHGVSRQLVKTVLSDKAKGAFQGAIHVAPHAQKTDAHQLGRALLLSSSAAMNAKPELEIYADDVKCAHGSTVGDLDEAAMFYLRSRGIGEAEARALLVRAFVDDVIDQAPAPEIAEAIRAEMERIIG